MNNSTNLYKNLMKQAQQDRITLNTNSLKALRKLYQDSIEDIVGKAETANGGFTKAWLKDYEKYLRYKMNELDTNIAKLTEEAIKASSEIAASVQGDFLSHINNKYELDIDKNLINFAYSVNQDVILSIINGGLYKDNKSLSERIWGYSEKNIQDIQYIINKGLMEQKSYEEIIRDLSKYVNPNAKKDWSWKKVYPKSNKAVDYNAQRLLRTSINHSFFNTNLKSWNGNPYVEAIHWELSGEHFVRQVKRFGEDICDEHTTQDNYNLGIGNFPKHSVPIPHPQCLCYQYAVIPKGLDDIGRELRKWVNGEENTILDDWFKGA